MPGFSQKATAKGLETFSKLLDPVALISTFSKSCDVQQLTAIILDMRNRLDSETVDKIDEAWDRARLLWEGARVDEPEDDHG